MIQKLVIFTLVTASLVTCIGIQPAIDTPVVATPPTMIEPTRRPLPGPINLDFLPQAGDNNFSRGTVFIDSSEVLIMESFPIQVALVLRGSLPTPCNQLRVIVNPPDEQNRILAEAYSVIDPAQTCIQALDPFEASIGLGSFPGGHYSVWVNGEMIGEFDS